MLGMILRGLDCAACYTVDILVTYKSHELYVQLLKIVFGILAKNNLTINTSKCIFGLPEVISFGYRLTNTGYSAPKDKVEAITSLPLSVDRTDLRSFLGMFNHFYTATPHASWLQAPLVDHLRDAKKRGKRPIHYTLVALQAFDDCKKALAEATELSYLLPVAPLVQTTNASGGKLGALFGAARKQYDQASWLLLTKPISYRKKVQHL